MEESVQSPPFELIDVVVRAGAGAGKTTELTQRVLKLAENFHLKHQKYPNFVVTTFTRKATQELRERLMKEALKRGDEGLAEFVKRPSQLQISTIHGILSIYLGRFGSIMGLSPKLEIISDQKERIQIKKKIRELCQKEESFHRDFQTLLENAEFSDILSAFGSYFRIYLQWGKVLPFGAADFKEHLSRKSDRIVPLVQQFAREIRACDLPEAWLEVASFCESRMLLSDQQSDRPGFWKSFLEALPAPRKTKAVPDSVTEIRDHLKKELEFFSSWRATDDFARAHDDFCAVFENCAWVLSEELRKTKLYSGEITMQDLETLSLLLIRQHPETAEAFSRLWNYWLVDEYQDTSPAQVELIKALSGASKSFVVGDPQQSIYLFRGARSEVFVEKEKEVQGQGYLYSKMTNYRSRPELLQFFNFFFTSLSSQFQRMEPKAPVTSPDAIVAHIFKIQPPENGTKGGTDPKMAESKPTLDGKRTDRDPEMLAVLFRCQELIESGVPAERICVLSRNNRHLEELSWLAQEFGIPVQVHSSGQFFERREIADALSLLKFLCNPHDNKNLIQLLRSPAFRVSDQLLADWCQESGVSFWQTFSKQKNEVIESLKAFCRQSEDTGLGPTWRDLLVKQGYFQYAHAMDPSGKREANLWKLISMVRAEERRPGFSYLEFLKNLDIRSLSTEEPEEADAVPVVEPRKVHLMTVHASKGLQFAHVILPKMGQTSPNPSVDFFLCDELNGRWTLSLLDPEEGKKVGSLSAMHLLETSKDRQKQEEDRVLYVALTRAEESVTLIWSENPKKDSWADRLKLKTTEGVHSEDFFSYQVRCGFFEPHPAAKTESIQPVIVHPYVPVLKVEVQNLSVTEILEKSVSWGRGSTSVGPKQNVADVQKAMTGVDVHWILESLKYQWMRNPGFRWQDLMLKLTHLQQQALKYVATDQEGLWLKVIRDGEVEFGMTIKFDDKLIQGQIDLWGPESEHDVWVVDYKTGNPAYQEKAFKQLEIYYWALRKMEKIHSRQNVHLAVIYPFSNLTLTRPAPAYEDIEREMKRVRE